jgi:hypothetical protein
MAEKRLYMIYEEFRKGGRSGLEYIHDEHAESPDKALEKAVEKGIIPPGDRYTIIADNNIVDRRAKR